MTTRLTGIFKFKALQNDVTQCDILLTWEEWCWLEEMVTEVYMIQTFSADKSYQILHKGCDIIATIRQNLASPHIDLPIYLHHTSIVASFVFYTSQKTLGFDCNINQSLKKQRLGAWHRIDAVVCILSDTYPLHGFCVLGAAYVIDWGTQHSVTLLN